MARRLRYLPLAVVTAISFVVVAGGYGGEALQPPTSEELRRLLPELRNPRIFTEADLKNDDERQAFRHDGLSFILRGDFDGNRNPDIVVAGRFDNRGNADDVAFVAILTKENSQWKRSFFLRPHARIIALREAPSDVVRTASLRPAILASFTVSGSDDYVLIYWDSQHYRYESGFDIVHDETERMWKSLQWKSR
jgi:hypothetical protein